MDLRKQITIIGKSMQEALSSASREFGIDESRLCAVETEKGVYLCYVEDLDAEIEISLSDDKMKATVERFESERGTGAAFDEGIFKDALADAGVVNSIVPDVYTKLETLIAKGDNVRGIQVARGIDPVEGRDGVLELDVETELSAGSRDEDGRIDYRERGKVKSVSEGQVLGRILPAEKGVPGKDVCGTVLPARDGIPAVFKLGENIEMMPDGTTFVSTIDGPVKYVHSVMSVTQQLEISGDVDFESGNITTLKGSVLIRGSVLSGFSVTSGANIKIGETVEEATIEANGNVEVGRGIAGGTVTAHGSVTAKFGLNSTIAAGGDVVVANNLTNCKVTAGDRVVVTEGKGVIRGGTITAALGIEAREIGSKFDAMTDIVIEKRAEDEIALTAEQNEITEALEQTTRFLGLKDDDSVRELLDQKGEKELETEAQVLEVLHGYRRRLTEIESLLSAIRKRKRRESKAIVVVHKTVYPGTTVTIEGRIYRVSSPIDKCSFRFDHETGKVLVEPL